MMFRDFRTFFRTVAAALLALGFAATLSAQTLKKNPTSKLYVADATGESQIDSGDKIQPLSKNAVHSPEGSVIETKANSTDALVLSNGTGLYVTADTRFEVKKFLQEPFTPNRTDLDVEPSISQTIIHVVRGGVGICTSKLVAGSTMTYRTPQAAVHVRGRRLMVQTFANETRVSLLEGDVTVVPEGTEAGQSLQPGQQAVIRRDSPESAASISIQAIPEAEAAKLDEAVSLACISRRTVSFETVETGADGGSEIVPVQTSPAQPQTEFTVSPARIEG